MRRPQKWVGVAIALAGLALSGCGSNSDEPGLFQRSLEASEREQAEQARSEAHLPKSRCESGGLSDVCRIAASAFGGRYVEKVVVTEDPLAQGKKLVAYTFRVPGLEPAEAVSLAIQAEAVRAFRQTFRKIPKARLSLVEVGAYAPNGRRIFDAQVNGPEVDGDPINVMRIVESVLPLE